MPTPSAEPVADKVELTLSNPWVAPDGNVHDVGHKISVSPELAERLVIGGTGVKSATK